MMKLGSLFAASVMLVACGGSGDSSSTDPLDAAGPANDAASGTDAPLDSPATVDTATAIDTGKTDGSCIELGYDCGSASCCSGTCDGTSGKCVSGPGGYCDGTKPNPDAYCSWGSVCDKSTNACVKMTCIDEHWMSVCSTLPDLGCCDPKLKCSKVSGPLGGDTCCAPDGTTLPSAAGASKCCSGSTTSIGDAGEIQCIPHPPGP
jgi:hypothetical protein